ncbi:hypothetical protein [Streptomyces sp. FH025]|nr:hypothetical protein [Streptomyces sp. FH025]
MSAGRATVFRILDGDVELSVHPRKATGPISRFRPLPEQRADGH